MAHWLDKVIELLNAETADLRELARIAGANPATFYRGINLADLDVNGQNLDGMQFSAGPDNEPNISSDKFKLLLDSDNREVEAIKAIQRTHQVKRQEERMAVLLDLILRNQKDALLIVNLYASDRAKYANRVLKEIATEIKANPFEGTLFEGASADQKFAPVRLARILNRPFSRGMPMNRALLLYYMAKHLSKYPGINAFLREKLANSWSMFIAPYRTEIQRFLDNANERALTNFQSIDSHGR